MIHFIKTTVVITTAFLLLGGVAFAETPSVEQALQDTKESVGELIIAKDENSPFEVSLKIKTFKKVVGLAITEAKDLKIKLITVDIDELEEATTLLWRDAMLKKINKVIAYYEEWGVYVSKNESLMSMEEIQTIASDFKIWREENYLDVSNQIQEFLLLRRSESALETTNRRWDKISKDLEILEAAEIEGVEKLWNMLGDARNLIDRSRVTSNQTSEVFFTAYIKPLVPEEPEETPEEVSGTISDEEPALITEMETETEIIPIEETNEETLAEPESEEVTETTDESSTFTPSEDEETVPADTNTTDDSPENAEELKEIPETSIKDLIKSSLEDIKEAYQVFIEMSGFVRELLS